MEARRENINHNPSLDGVKRTMLQLNRKEQFSKRNDFGWQNSHLVLPSLPDYIYQNREEKRRPKSHS
jgi:hypothetical protein